jgi:uncharacterized protein YoxC
METVNILLRNVGVIIVALAIIWNFIIIPIIIHMIHENVSDIQDTLRRIEERMDEEEPDTCPLPKEKP